MRPTLARWSIPTAAIALMVLLTCAGPPLRAQPLTFDFRGGKLDDDNFRLRRTHAERYVKPEAGGRRIQLSGGAEPNNPVGIERPVRIQGDFAVTERYEIAKVERPTSGGGVGAELYLPLDTPARDGLAFT